MFENESAAGLQAMLDGDPEFRRLYHKHRRLDRQLHDADVGVLPMDATARAGLKREKLQLKQRLQTLWDRRPASD
ncbi:YdcH family protein [Frateuria aurantia]